MKHLKIDSIGCAIDQKRANKTIGGIRTVTQEKIYEMVAQGKLSELHEEGLLDVGLLKIALELNVITNDEAISWYETLCDL